MSLETVIRAVSAGDEMTIRTLLLGWASEGGWSDLPGPAHETPEGVGVAWRAGDYSGWIEPDWTALIDVPDWAFLMAVSARDGEAIGFVRGKVVEAARSKLAMAVPDGGTLFEVTELYVVAAWRGAGVGSTLLTTILEAASERGLTRSTLVTASERTDDVVRFYRRHGFEPWWVEMLRNVEPRAPK